MVPLRRDAFKGEAEGFALSGSKRRDAQVHCVGIRSARLQHAQGHSFSLGKLGHRVLERDFDHHVRDHLIARVAYGTVEVVHGRADEILGCAHLEITEFDVGRVRRRPSGRFLLRAGNEKQNDHDRNDNRNPDPNRAPIGIALFHRGIRLDESAHAGIVLFAASSPQRHRGTERFDLVLFKTCHSERSEKSAVHSCVQEEIPHRARNDKS